jgi:hypothetical protein
MQAAAISALVFAATLVALHLGCSVARRLPEHHLLSDARQVAHVGIGMLATLLALVLGLSVTSAKHAFDDRSAEVVKLASTVVLLDSALSGLGPAAQPARDQLREIFATVRSRVEQGERPVAHPAAPAMLDNLTAVTRLQHVLLALRPGDASHTWYQGRAMQLSSDIAQERVLAAEHVNASIPPALLAIVVSWVLLIYFGLGVFGIDNSTVRATLAAGAFCFAWALFLILELDMPYDGLIRIPTEPLQRAAQMIAR